MPHFLPVPLVVGLLLTPMPPDPRPCRGTATITADTTVESLGRETEGLLQWTFNVPGPEYPAELRSLREGHVVARFVVDTNGRVMQGTASIVSESHRGFGRSVCQFLERARLRSVPVDGRKRSVAVTAAPFVFSFGR